MIIILFFIIKAELDLILPVLSAVCFLIKAYGAIDLAMLFLRVLSRVYRISDNIALNNRLLMLTRNFINQLIVGYDSSSFNQGLMDLANAICKP